MDGMWDVMGGWVPAPLALSLAKGPRATVARSHLTLSPPTPPPPAPPAAAPPRSPRPDRAGPMDLNGNFTEKLWALDTKLYRPNPLA